jgi:membrane protein
MAPGKGPDVRSLRNPADRRLRQQGRRAVGRRRGAGRGAPRRAAPGRILTRPGPADPGPRRAGGPLSLRWWPRTMQALALRVLHVWNRTADRELSLIAAGVAFFGFLAIFPGMAAVIAIWGFASDPGVIRGQVALLQDVLPPAAYDLVLTQVEGLLAQNSQRGLGWATVVSVLLALWSARAGIAALMQGINAIHGTPARNGIWAAVLAFLTTLALVALALAALALMVVAPVVIVFLPLGRVEAASLTAANLGLGLLTVTVAISILYQIGPNSAAHRRPPLLSRGLGLALVLWVAVSKGLVLYLTNFPSYNQVYGSIGAVAALLLWFYLSAYAILLGAAVDAERAQRRGRRQ